VSYAFAIFPHQLFQPTSELIRAELVLLIEDPLFFSQYAFHKAKLAFHRASMKALEELLVKQGARTRYIEATAENVETEDWCKSLKEAGIDSLHCYDPVDYLLERRLRRCARNQGLKLTLLESPQFLCDRAYADSYFKNAKRYHLTTFYTDQRKRLGILVDPQGNPIGGKWTYDTENRKRLPKGTRIPPLPRLKASKIHLAADKYANATFKENPGETGHLVLPLTHEESEKWLDAFLEERLAKYGDYQDAINRDESYLFHSLISPLLNVGLLSPDVILQKALDTAAKLDIPMNALEGFVRQVMGWREFVRIVYRLRGTDERTKNFWSFSRKIPPAFYTGNTGIAPIDAVIKRTLKTGYAHHIERLMVLGNFMVLCEFDPDEVYRWFMEMYIDAYDWVMVPNVYGMSQYADGGLMSTKPYISGSNYILKMSDFEKNDWCEIWDALYWRFIHLHKVFFLRNPRMSIMVRQVEKMETKRFEHLMKTAEAYLQSLDSHHA
jgi:deoxyribodipyrimidine photolyase-related protein